MFISRFVDERLIKDIADGEKAQPVAELDPKRIVEQIVHRARAGAGLSFDVFEALIQENDLVEINYLERGLMAARAVCRINVAAMVGDNADWGTGFLIGPRLLVTNNHVIGTPEDARRATVEFGYELDAEGRLKRTTRFRLTPEDGFVTSHKTELDYTVVAIAELSEDGRENISQFGYLRLDPQTGKTEVGQYATIIQHPESRTKRISLRENKFVKYGDELDPARDNFLWYSSDTAPGSSGAPLTSDAWQVVCIHHAGVPHRETRNGKEYWRLVDGTELEAATARRLPVEKIKWLANEGLRVSKLVADLAEQVSKLAPPPPLLKALVDDATGVEAFPGTSPGQSIVGPPLVPAPAIHIAAVVDTALLEAATTPKKKVRPPGYFDGRKGYEENFLSVEVPLPKLTANALKHGAPAKVAGADDNVLRYQHFSVVFNADERRKLAFFTAVNIDGSRWTNLDRGNDVWYYDPRIPEHLQNGDELYGNEPVPSKNYFDRGHLVRRLDPVWGDIRTAKLANDDTFVWPNCSPQYWGFNQGADLWQGLENFLLYNTDEEDVKASVFSGPIFSSGDELHRGILIPQYFWKVIAVVDKDSTLYTSGYIVSQKDYALNIPFERLPVGPNSDEGENFQVPISKISAETGLSFAPVILGADVYRGADEGRRLRSLADVQHPRR